MSGTCETCRWWRKGITIGEVEKGVDGYGNRNVTRGLCRAHTPPWHETNIKDWCGEHTPNEARAGTAPKETAPWVKKSEWHWQMSIPAGLVDFWPSKQKWMHKGVIRVESYTKMMQAIARLRDASP